MTKIYIKLMTALTAIIILFTTISVAAEQIEEELNDGGLSTVILPDTYPESCYDEIIKETEAQGFTMVTNSNIYDDDGDQNLRVITFDAPLSVLMTRREMNTGSSGCH